MFQCPVGESSAEVENRGLRMSVMRSGAVQLAVITTTVHDVAYAARATT